jgi:hypothetical protein
MKVRFPRLQSLANPLWNPRRVKSQHCISSLHHSCPFSTLRAAGGRPFSAAGRPGEEPSAHVLYFHFKAHGSWNNQRKLEGDAMPPCVLPNHLPIRGASAETTGQETHAVNAHRFMTTRKRGSGAFSLNGVSTKFQAGIYKTATEMRMDVHLVWKNCLVFNGNGSPIYLQCRKLADRYWYFSCAFSIGCRRSVWIKAAPDPPSA